MPCRLLRGGVARHGGLLGGQGLAMLGASNAAAQAERVASAADLSLWERVLQLQISLGDTAVIERIQQLATPAGLTNREVPRPQRSRPLRLVQGATRCATRGEAFRQAHTRGGMSMSAIAAAQGLSVARVSQLIWQAGMKLRFKT